MTNDVIALKKRALKRYRKNRECVERLKDKLSTLTQKIESVRIPTLSGMPRGGSPITVDDLIADKIQLEDRIARLEDKGRTLKAEILEEIDALEDVRFCEVLELYFIDCKSMEDIAEISGYNPRYVYDLYSRGVALIAEKTQ